MCAKFHKNPYQVGTFLVSYQFKLVHTQLSRTMPGELDKWTNAVIVNESFVYLPDKTGIVHDVWAFRRIDNAVARTTYLSIRLNAQALRIMPDFSIRLRHIYHERQ